MANYLFFRFDASSNIGLGHAFRCIALIEFISNNFQQYPLCCLVVTKCLPHFLQEKLEQLNSKIYLLSAKDILEDELSEIKQLQKNYNVKGLILDGYQFDENYRQELRQLNMAIINFDDTNDSGKLHCDVVINALSNANMLSYESSAPKAKYLLGLKYSIIRKEFTQQTKTSFKQRNLLLINFGGSDIGGLTLPIVKILARVMQEVGQQEVGQQVLIPENVVVVTGGACENIKDINQFCQKQGYRHVHQCDNMAELLSQCKLAICAPGAIVYELAYSQVPSVFLTIADNQLLSAQAHQNSGWCLAFNGRGVEKKDNSLLLAVSAMMSLWQDQIKLDYMSKKAGEIVDGKGVERIVKAIYQLLFVVNTVNERVLTQ